jgi:hypothetical protein
MQGSLDQQPPIVIRSSLGWTVMLILIDVGFVAVFAFHFLPGASFARMY